MNTDLTLYAELLGDIKARIRRAQTRAMSAVNAELVRLYWDIGRLIDRRQRQEGWGAGVIPRLAQDLNNELPDLKGFSERNIKLMVQFFMLTQRSFQLGNRRLPNCPPTQKGNHRLPKYPGPTTCC